MGFDIEIRVTELQWCRSFWSNRRKTEEEWEAQMERMSENHRERERWVSRRLRTHKFDVHMVLQSLISLDR